jgi:tetratricopeptide (TPR) repeat protein
MSDARQDYHKILRVSPNATVAEIKTAFRQLARQYHPDLNPDNTAAQEQFRRICEAYEVLLTQAQQQPRDRPVTAPPPHRDPYNFYIKGVQQALANAYHSAIASYTKAIELRPDFVEAYLRRSELYYRLGDDRAVLADCHQALALDPHYAEAYYYQARARHRLGYVQSALEAYHRTLELNADNAEAFYHRGVVQHDLGDREAAIADIQRAAQLFRQQGDESGYQLAKDTILQLKPGLRGRWRYRGRRMARQTRHNLYLAVQTGILAIFNPGRGLKFAFEQLPPQGALAIGFAWGAIANLTFSIGAYGWRDSFNFAWFDVLLLGCVPFASLVLLVAIARVLFAQGGSWEGDIFLSGATLIPIGFLALASGFSQTLGMPVMLILTAWTCCYSPLLLYCGLTQLSRLSEALAAFFGMLFLLIVGWLSYTAFASLFLRV